MMLKDTLKSLRGLWAINAPIRWFAYYLTGYFASLRKFFNKHWPAVGIVTVRLPGGSAFRLYTEGDDWIATQAFWKGFGGYEGPCEHLFDSLARRSGTIVDVGANIGYYSLIAAAANPSAKVISFEPAANANARLRHHAKMNAFPNIIAESLIVSDDSRPTSFFLPRGAEIGQVLAASTKRGWADATDEVILPSISLDEYKRSRGLERIDLVKMDCEFHEREVLEGMKDILKEDRPDLLMEVLFYESDGVKGQFNYSQAAEIERILLDNGYNFYLISESALIRMDHLEHNPDNRNYLFSVKRSSRQYIPYADADFLYSSRQRL